jgi:DnaK suppressor protein
MSRVPAPADSPAADDELAAYRTMLERQWRAQLDDVTRLSIELADGRGDGRGSAGGGAFELSSVTRRLLAAARLQLEETEAALRRLDQGCYGICAGCHLAIPRPRLEALPTARLCLPCLHAFRSGEHSGLGTHTAPHAGPR